MSTRSAIIVKVKPTDLKKIVRFDKEKLGTNIDDWSCYGEQTRPQSAIGDVELKCKYIGIYCHFDGDLDGVGATLKERYNTYDKALNLILGGNASVIWEDKYRHYANRVEYDITWEENAPNQSNNLQKLVETIVGSGNWGYVFEDDTWKCHEDGVMKYRKTF